MKKFIITYEDVITRCYTVVIEAKSQKEAIQIFDDSFDTLSPKEEYEDGELRLIDVDEYVEVDEGEERE